MAGVGAARRSIRRPQAAQSNPSLAHELPKLFEGLRRTRHPDVGGLDLNQVPVGEAYPQHDPERADSALGDVAEPLDERVVDPA
jgi:hypothetical protein